MKHSTDLREVSPELRQVLDADPIATYQIEILYGEGRTPSGPNAAMVSFFIKGSRLGGGGDEKLYMCLEADATTATQPAHKFRDIKRKRQRLGCGAFITPSCVKGGVAVCPGCGNMLDISKATGEILYKLPTSQLAEKLAKFWVQLEGDSDLYIKYHHTDIRYQEMVVREGSPKTRQLRGLLAYPMANILKDTAAGKTIETAFADCLSA